MQKMLFSENLYFHSFGTRFAACEKKDPMFSTVGGLCDDDLYTLISRLRNERLHSKLPCHHHRKKCAQQAGTHIHTALSFHVLLPFFLLLKATNMVFELW